MIYGLKAYVDLNILKLTEGNWSFEIRVVEQKPKGSSLAADMTSRVLIVLEAPGPGNPLKLRELGSLGQKGPQSAKMTPFRTQNFQTLLL